MHNDICCATRNFSQDAHLRNSITTSNQSRDFLEGMGNITQIYRSKQPSRPHFIPEWAERRGFDTQAKLINALDADKSVVSRWYNGSSPSREWQDKLADLFQCEPEALFRHPDDDWMARFLRKRSDEEIKRVKQILRAAFPDDDEDQKASG